MLKLGYKASGEQFGPSELLEFSCLAEEIAFRGSGRLAHAPSGSSSVRAS